MSVEQRGQEQQEHEQQNYPLYQPLIFPVTEGGRFTSNIHLYALSHHHIVILHAFVYKWHNILYLYISTKTGDNLRQITPKGFYVISWTLSKDKKMILVKGKNDKNKNKKFGNGDDELYYRIDLDDDISKINCYQINM